MPHIDLESIICRAGSGGDGRRVACETILNADIPHSESIYLSKDEEIDNWFGRSANVYYERKESTKANSNPNSQRLILTSKSKPSIIGLPKPQTSTFHDRRPVKPGKTGFFPKRLGSAGKFSLREPSSPRVSCMGRVRSKNRKSSTAASSNSKPKKAGFWARFGNVFRFSRGKSRPVGDDGEKSESWSKKQNEAKVNVDVDVVNPPGLGGMNRFVSGRRSDAWAGEALNVEKVQEGD